MGNLDYGLALTVIGMGTTFAMLIFLGFVMDVMKRFFPVEQPKPVERPAPAKEAGGRA